MVLNSWRVGFVSPLILGAALPSTDACGLAATDACGLQNMKNKHSKTTRENFDKTGSVDDWVGFQSFSAGPLAYPRAKEVEGSRACYSRLRGQQPHLYSQPPGTNDWRRGAEAQSTHSIRPNRKNNGGVGLKILEQHTLSGSNIFRRFRIFIYIDVIGRGGASLLEHWLLLCVGWRQRR